MINAMIYVISTLVTYFLGVISKKFKWNETVPVPIQNILVGFIVFVVAYITTKPDPTELFNQIIVALGGAGTATLGYDASKLSKEEK